MKHRIVIGIDPGTRTGWAVFVDGALLSAGTVTGTTLDDLPDILLLPAIVVVERPVIYVQGRGSKGDPNDLVMLALLAGRIAGRFEMREPCVDIAFVRPRTWKGSVPKHITNRRTIDALGEDEIARLPKRPRAKTFDHNMLDAVGIGLWQLTREQQR